MLSTDQFYAQVAKTLNNKISNKDARKVIDGVKNVIVQELNSKGSVKVPNIATFRLKTKPAREAGIRKVFGKEVHLAAKPATSKLRMRIANCIRSKIPL